MLKKGFLWFMVLFLSYQIFSFSGAVAAESDSTSKKITTAVVHVIKQIIPIPEQEERALFDICHVVVRKTAHFSEYLLLAASVLALARSYLLKMRYAVLISAGYSLLYAIGDEVHQLFVDGRSGQFTDVLIDFAGALVGVGIYCAVKFLCDRRKQKRIII